VYYLAFEPRHYRTMQKSYSQKLNFSARKIYSATKKRKVPDHLQAKAYEKIKGALREKFAGDFILFLYKVL